MPLPLSNPYCPQCGAAGCMPVRGRVGIFACQACFAQIDYGLHASGLYVGAAPGTEAVSNPLWRHRKWVMAVVAGVLALPLALPPLLRLFQPSATPADYAAQLPGRVEAATVVEHNGKPAYLRVMEQRKQGQAQYSVLVTDLASGKPLADAQQISLPSARGSQQPQLRQFSDGLWYLVLNERHLLRLEPGTLRFVDITASLGERFAQDLGKGVVKLSIQGDGRPDCFEVLSSDGQQFYLYWLTGQLLPYGDSSKLYAQAQATYQQLRSQFRFVDLPRPTGQERVKLLVQAWSRYEPGQMANYDYFDLTPTDSAAVRESPNSYVAVGSGYAVRPYAVKDRGLVKIQAVAPATPRFHAQVLAHNASRVLLAYNPTPLREEGRVFQLLDTSNQQIVWSRTAEQLPQLSARDGGAWATGRAVYGGFLLQMDSASPALLIDNQGVVLHDFTAAAQRAR